VPQNRWQASLNIKARVVKVILLTGATGRTGGKAALELAARKLAVRALVRNADKAAALKTAGVELAIGDVDDATALAAACRGVTKVLVCLPNGQQQLAREKAIVDAAVRAGARHIVKVSSVEAHAHMMNPVHQTHWQSEQHIRASGVSWTMVRPTFYMQNFLGSAASIKAKNEFYFPFGEKGAAALIDSRDAGYFAAHVLATDGHAGQSYDITSPDKKSFHQVAETMTQVLGRPIRYVPQDPVAYREFLSKFVTNEWHLNAVCDIFAEIARGYTVDVTDTYKRVTGRDAKSLVEFIGEYRGLFQV
jgi:uncharacterized protein YbjT (DUF2867 family)